MFKIKDKYHQLYPTGEYRKTACVSEITTEMLIEKTELLMLQLMNTPLGKERDDLDKIISHNMAVIVRYGTTESLEPDTDS
jgi:hypothetical protein|tara:strand:+ start:262 stop:504 length:243 start_codon:yes stop_codon:yes gene_type:complete